MRTTSATLLLLTAIGCGGAREQSRETSEPTASAPAAPTPVAATAAESPAPAAEQPAATATPAAAPQEAATPAAAAAPAGPSTARAELKMVTGDKSLGTMNFERKDKTIAISGQFSGYKKGQYALYIHTKGDCSAKARNVGGHLNPTKAKHGPPASPMRHAGDFGDLTFDKEGNATFAMETDSVTMEPGRADSVVGRALVVYSRKDNKSGKAGTPIACGVIAVEGGGAATEARTSYTSPAATPTSSSR